MIRRLVPIPSSEGAPERLLSQLDPFLPISKHQAERPSDRNEAAAKERLEVLQSPFLLRMPLCIRSTCTLPHTAPWKRGGGWGSPPPAQGPTELERVRGIEPPFQAWEACVLPLNHARVVLPFGRPPGRPPDSLAGLAARARPASVPRLMTDPDLWPSLLSRIAAGDSLFALRRFRKNPDYYTLHLRSGEGLAVVASEPLDDIPQLQCGLLADNVRRYASGLPLVNVVDKQRGY